MNGFKFVLAATVSVSLCMGCRIAWAEPTTGTTLAAPTTDLSGARKKRKAAYVHVRRKTYVTDSRSPYYLRPGVKPSFGYIGPPGYAGEYAWRKSIGQCVEDLGYGRWSACGWR